MYRHAEDLSFTRISLDSTGYAPIGGWDFKEIYMVLIVCDIAGNETIKLGTSHMPRTKFAVPFGEQQLSIIFHLW